MSDEDRPYYLEPTRLSDVSDRLAQGEQPLDKDRSIIAQSAGKDAVELVKVAFADGGSVADVVSAYKDIKREVFNDTLALAGAESVVESFEGGQSAPTTQQAAPSGPAGGGASRPNAELEVRSGKFAGKTLGQIAEEKDGPSWLDWASRELKNDFLKTRIQQFLNAA